MSLPINHSNGGSGKCKIIRKSYNSLLYIASGLLHRMDVSRFSIDSGEKERQILVNLSGQIEPQSKNPRHPGNAKITTILLDILAPSPEPERVPIHSAPVVTLERRSQFESYTNKGPGENRPEP